MSEDAEEIAAKICEAGGGGLLYKAGSDADWPTYPRALLIIIGLAWTFLGVAIVADIFMVAIETITSQHKTLQVKDPDGRSRKMHVKVWNATVANLTLMALGSSAPEILLSVIELLGNKYYTGELGPATIVGSAAFNLFIIIAVCVVSIPPGECRRVADVSVFAVTSFFSIFAYVWLYIVLIISTPNLVTLAGMRCIFVFLVNNALNTYLYSEHHLNRGDNHVPFLPDPGHTGLCCGQKLAAAPGETTSSESNGGNSRQQRSVCHEG
jgi:solute carrier family 8 (sodium/calcium exchanger)